MNKREQIYSIAQVGIKVFEYIANIYANTAQNTLQSLQTEYEEKTRHLFELTNNQSNCMSPEACNDPDALAGVNRKKNATIHNLRRDIVDLSLKIQEVKQSGLSEAEQPMVRRVEFNSKDFSFCVVVEYDGGEEGHYETFSIFGVTDMNWEDLAAQSQDLIHSIGQFASKLSKYFNSQDDLPGDCESVLEIVDIPECGCELGCILSGFYGTGE